MPEAERIKSFSAGPADNHGCPCESAKSHETIARMWVSASGLQNGPRSGYLIRLYGEAVAE